MKGLRRLVLLCVMVSLAGCDWLASIDTTEDDTPIHRYTQPVSDPVEIKLGYHYKPPSDDTTAEAIARSTSFIILTKNDERFRDQLRSDGYTGKILQYIRGSEVDGPLALNGDPCDASYKPLANQVADGVGDFCELIYPHEDWFLHNGAGERLYNTDGSDRNHHFYQMNPASPGWRAFVVERLKRNLFGDETQPPLGYDGIFFDNVRFAMSELQKKVDNDDGIVKEFASDDEYVEAWRGWLETIRAELGTTTPIWANLIPANIVSSKWQAYVPYLDGAMNEGFMTGFSKMSPEQQDAVLDQADYLLAHGKGLYAVSQGGKKNTNLQQFGLASFLLVAQPNSPAYFRYTRSEQYSDWTTYDNYSNQLGAPLGPRYRIDNGWRRDFANGYVTIDQAKQRGEIVPGAVTP